MLRHSLDAGCRGIGSGVAPGEFDYNRLTGDLISLSNSSGAAGSAAISGAVAAAAGQQRETHRHHKGEGQNFSHFHFLLLFMFTVNRLTYKSGVRTHCLVYFYDTPLKF